MIDRDPAAVHYSTAAYVAKNSLLQHCLSYAVSGEPTVISTTVARGSKPEPELIDDLTNSQYQAENAFFWASLLEATRDKEILAADIKAVLSIKVPADKNSGHAFIVFPESTFISTRDRLRLSDFWKFGQVSYRGIFEGFGVFTIKEAAFIAVLAPGAVQARAIPAPMLVTDNVFKLSTEIRISIDPSLVTLMGVPLG